MNAPRKLPAIQPFHRPREIEAWPDSPQLPAGHRVMSNRSWRTLWPQIEFGPCNKCTLCILYCPDAAIASGDDGYPRVSEDWCKGCGICAAECPKACIEMFPPENAASGENG